MLLPPLIDRPTRLTRVVAIAAATAAGCSDGAVSPSRVAPASEVAATRIRALAGQFPRAVAPAAVERFDVVDGGGLRPAPRARDALDIELPAGAAGQVRLADPASGVAVAFSLEGAAPVPAVVSGGYVLYPAAAPSGGDILHRVAPSGTEDLVHFVHAPARPELRYRVDVTRVAGLRLLQNTLEVLDATGAPRLRVAPPSLVDAGGRRFPAALALEGCHADTSARAPWGQPVTAPGAAACTVVVSWAGLDVRYPALVDPEWMATKSMAVERTLHAVARLTDPGSQPCDAGRVLVTGGVDKDGVVLASVELYEPLSRTFATVAPMSQPRAGHTATFLATGYVLIAGGAGTLLDAVPPEKLRMSSLDSAKSTEIYDDSSQVCSSGPPMTAPRFFHTATALGGGRVLLAGGVADQLNQPTHVADVFSFDGAPPTFGAIVATAGTMQNARSGHAAALLADGSVLLAGGIGTASYALSSAEVFSADASGGHFTTAGTQMTVARAFFTATVLSNGDVLLAGGVNAIKNPANPSAPIGFSHTADLYTGGAFQAASIPMTATRAFHVAARLLPPMQLPASDALDGGVPEGGTTEAADAILAGGFDDTADLASTEVYIPASKSFRSMASVDLLASRRGAAAVLVNAGDSTENGCGVLVTGGVGGSSKSGGVLTNGMATRSAEVLLKPLGEPCVHAAECLSGWCSGGVCCDRGCTDACWSCTAAAKQSGPDGTCGPRAAGWLLGVYCDQTLDPQVEVHNQCDGLGNVVPADGTHACAPAICGPDGYCSKFCAANSDCGSTGWCDEDVPPDGGAPDAGGPLGTCQVKRDKGAACAFDYQCKSAFCVDAVCCEDACDVQCKACDLDKGTCVLVGKYEPKGQPHPHPQRSGCAGYPESCGGWCGDTTSCEYPDGGTLLDVPTCVDHEGTAASTTVTLPCDGHGSAITVHGDCGGFRCADEHACKTSCSADADCVLGYVCLDGDAGLKACQLLTEPLCADDGKTLRQPGGTTEACGGHLRCPQGANACLTKCASYEDCRDGLVCDGEACVPRLSSPKSVPFCAAGPARGSSGAAGSGIAALMLGLGIALRRITRS